MEELTSDKDSFIQALLAERDRLFQENSRLKSKLEDKTDVESLKSSYEDTINHQQQKILSLEHQVAYLQRRIWGKSSERFIKEDPQQRRLDFDGLELLPEEKEEARLAEEEITLYKTRTITVKEKSKPVRKPIPENIPRIDEHIYPENINLEEWIELDPEITEVLEHKPEEFFVRRIIRHKYIRFIDPDGKDSYLLVWFSADGETGHAGIAIDNYKRQEKKDKDGNVVRDSKGNTQYEMVKDGTMTYYDLWPSISLGGSEYQKNVAPDYSNGIKINSLADLKSKDPTGTRSGEVSAEGRKADGIVQITTTYSQDSRILNYASTTAESGREYNASIYNCSTFAEGALKAAFPQLDARQHVKIPFPLNLTNTDVNVVAPNNLYNATKKLSGAKIISGPTDVVAKPYLKYFGK